MIRNIYHLAVKECLHLWRDRRTLIFLILTPTALTVMFGYALQASHVTHVTTRLVDLDHGRIGEEYIKDISADQTFTLTVVKGATPADLQAAEDDFAKDRLQAIVVLPADLTANIMEGSKGEVRAIVDASDTFSAPAVLQALHTVAIRHNLKLAAGYMLYEGLVKTEAQAAQRVQPVELKTDLRFNPELKMQNFTIPGIVGLILQLLTVIVMATSIARERERGTMEQLATTPLSGAEIFIGKLVPYFLLALLDTVNAMAVARWLFGVELGGHFGPISVLVIVFVLGSLGIGQLISAVSKNQGQAIQLAVFYIVPVFVFSGAFAPIDTMPPNVRPISLLFPLTYFCRGFRACLLRQATLADIRWDIFALLVFVVVTFGASVIVLRARPGAPR